MSGSDRAPVTRSGRLIWKKPNAIIEGGDKRMATLNITLPDALAREAAKAGLLTPATIERLLRERLRADRVERLANARSRLSVEPLGPMTSQEIADEIKAYRAER